MGWDVRDDTIVVVSALLDLALFSFVSNGCLIYARGTYSPCIRVDGFLGIFDGF